LVLSPAANQYDIVFQNNLGGSDQVSLVADGVSAPGLTGGTVSASPVANGFGNEVQRISFNPGTIGGSFTLNYVNTNNGITQTIAYSSNPLSTQASIQAQMDALFGPGNSLV